DQVCFVPAARSPFKVDRQVAPFAQRGDMLHLAVAGYPRFRIDTLEGERSGPRYMADTLAGFQRRHPAAGISFIVGSGVLPTMPQWYEPQHIVELATLLVVARPHHPVMAAEELRTALRLTEAVPLRLQTVQVPLIDLSSTELRQRIAVGRTVRYLLP